jgi:hypothetical protein
MEPRYFVEPDPAWDLSDLEGETLSVELSWMPDALAGRLEELVASPALVRALQEAALTGFTTQAARGYFTENSLDDSAAAPELRRLVVGDDPAADLAYLPRTGLVASEQAVAVLRAHCTRTTFELLTHP